MTVVGTVSELWQYPVKSLQGTRAGRLSVGAGGVEGDRRWALIDGETGALLSAKRRKELLLACAIAGGDVVALPDGSEVVLADDNAGAALSAWLGQPVEVRGVADAGDESLAYQMTFDPPDDDAEYYDIPAPAGTFLDLAAVHVIHQATLDACAAARPDLDWSVRRFRPNVVLAGDLDAPFAEQAWIGRELQVGGAGIGAVLRVDQPTVRCAMPLREQVDGIAREPGIYHALNELNTEFPNHLGLYLSVVEPGVVACGDAVALRS